MTITVRGYKLKNWQCIVALKATALLYKKHKNKPIPIEAFDKILECSGNAKHRETS